MEIDDDSVHVYYEYDSVDKTVKKRVWDQVCAQPSYKDASESFGQLTLMCKRVRKGSIQKKNPTKSKDINKEWTKNIAHGQRTVCDLAKLFKISNRLQGTLDQVTSSSKEKNAFEARKSTSFTTI